MIVHRINFFYIINFSIVIINDISDRAMIDKEEDGGKEKPPIYFGELYADVSYHMGSNSAIFIYFYFSVTVVSVKWCRCLLQVRYIVKFWVTFFFSCVHNCIIVCCIWYLLWNIDNKSCILNDNDEIMIEDLLNLM